MAKGRHAHRRLHGAVIVGAVIGVVVLVAGGAAYSAYRYEMANADRILPGVRIQGVDVGGMTRGEAADAVGDAIGDDLDERFIIRLGERTWSHTEAELGRRAMLDEAVDRALAVNEQHGTFDRFWRRFRDTPVDVDLDVRFVVKTAPVERLVEQIADEVWRPGRDAAITITRGRDDIRFVRPSAGAKLARGAAVRRITRAIDAGRPVVELELAKVAAEVGVDELGPTVVVRVDRNRLELYDGFDLVRHWDVATAKPGYTTPGGVWTIWDKRENPTWYNPALDDWGADLPAVIPGGPGNPMGTRALYIDAPGLIRIHGTTDPSSIGRYASHGCIRMRNEEIEDLFERIPVGTHVIVVGSRPASAGYWDTPAASDI